MSFLPEQLPLNLNRQLVLAGTACFAAGLLFRSFTTKRKPPSIIPSPRKTLLSKLSTEEQHELPYPPDAFPGARDVDSPYGSIRVYEFGPEDGRKVLFVHGISTPCIALGGVAHGLADQGCRVMLFDLFGRGYSDDPDDLPQDIRLFTTQILLALASSPISWTGADSGKFSLVGYSLGGGVSTAFTSYFPDLVRSLILIAPAGLIRSRHIATTSRVLYHEGLIPEPLIHLLIKRRIRTPLYAPTEKDGEDESVEAAGAATAEVDVKSRDRSILSKTYPNIIPEEVLAHQVDNHGGFVSAFISSIRFAPIQNQHHNLRRVAKHFSQREEGAASERKVLIFCGSRDPVIIKDELYEDAMEALDGNLDFRILEAGHEVAMSKSAEIVQHISDFWG